MAKKAPVYEILTEEITHHPILGLLAVLTVLMHLWILVRLMQPADEENKTPQQMKIMEVALVAEIKPKAEPPPAPPKPSPPEKEPPKKKLAEPPFKKKPPVVHKEGEIAKPKMVFKETPPALPAPSLTPSKKETTASPQPTFTSKTAVKPAAETGSGKSQGVNSGVVELGCPKPKYPARAMSRHIEGWVKIEMTIGADGRVSNARVAGSEPPGIFDEAALTAINSCKFKPRLVNGKAVAQRGVKKSTFKLTN